MQIYYPAIIFLLFSNYPCVRHYSSIEHIGLSLNMSLYSFLEQFHKLCPYVFDITIHLGKCFVSIKLLYFIEKKDDERMLLDEILLFFSLNKEAEMHNFFNGHFNYQ